MTSRFKLQIQTGEGKVRWADADKVFAHLMQEYTRAELKTKANMEKRLDKFKVSVLQSDFTEEYEYKLLEEFIEYWVEPNKSGTKMRFELEKTWNLSMRIKRWVNNDFGKKKANGKSNYKLDTTGFPMAYCEKCGISNSYKYEELNGDSRCCNSKLLPEKPVAVR